MKHIVWCPWCRWEYDATGIEKIKPVKCECCGKPFVALKPNTYMKNEHLRAAVSDQVNSLSLGPETAP